MGTHGHGPGAHPGRGLSMPRRGGAVPRRPEIAASQSLFPNHELGTPATLDVGVETTLNQRVSLCGALSVGKELDGTDLSSARLT